MSNIKVEKLTVSEARKEIENLMTDETITVNKIDLRLVSGGYKLIATTHPVEKETN